MLPPLVKPRRLITFLWDQLFSLLNPLPHSSSPVHSLCSGEQTEKHCPTSGCANAHTEQTERQTTHSTTQPKSADLLAHTRAAIFRTRLRTRGTSLHHYRSMSTVFFPCAFFRLATPALPRHTHTNTLMRGRGIIQRTVELPSELCAWDDNLRIEKIIFHQPSVQNPHLLNVSSHGTTTTVREGCWKNR